MQELVLLLRQIRRHHDPRAGAEYCMSWCRGGYPCPSRKLIDELFIKMGEMDAAGPDSNN